MAVVKQFKASRFFTVETDFNYPRYFNGRKFSVRKCLVHYVNPHHHARNFTDMVNSVVFCNGHDYPVLRYSTFTVTAREQAK